MQALTKCNFVTSLLLNQKASSKDFNPTKLKRNRRKNYENTKDTKMAKTRFNAVYENKELSRWRKLADKETDGNLSEFIRQKVNEAIRIETHLGKKKYQILLAETLENGS